MKLFVFGNQDNEIDDVAPLVSHSLSDIPNLEIITIPPNGDLPVDSSTVYILDRVLGIDKVTLITQELLDNFQFSPRNSAHDYDLSFQLKYLTKIGVLKNFYVIGLPEKDKIDYDLIHSILRKLVAQDMQGS